MSRSNGSHRKPNGGTSNDYSEERLYVVERAFRRQTFGALSTLTEHGHPHATGVVYAVSPIDQPLILYVTTRTTTRKVRNIRAHPEVAFVVPVPHRIVPVFPPRAIQFQGTAAVVSGEDEDAVRAFGSSLFLRGILVTEQRIVAGGGELCFYASAQTPPCPRMELGCLLSRTCGDRDRLSVE